MIHAFEKCWPIISTLILLALLIALIFCPSSAGTFAIAMLILGLGMALLFIVRRQTRAYQENKIDRATLARNIFFEVLGLSLTIALSILLAQIVAGTISPLVGISWWSIGLTISLSILGGLGAAWLVNVTWSKLIRTRGLRPRFLLPRVTALLRRIHRAYEFHRVHRNSANLQRQMQVRPGFIASVARKANLLIARNFLPFGNQHFA